MKRRHIFIFLVSFFVVVIDQLLKFYFMKTLQPGRELVVIENVLSFALAYNTGAGFSILQNQNALLIWLTVAIIGFLLYNAGSFQDHWMASGGFALVIGGAVGNLIDRIRLGSVVDFIDLSFWPTFNAADMAVSIGVIMILLQSLFSRRLRGSLD